MTLLATSGVCTAESNDSPPSLHQPPIADEFVDRYLLTPQGNVEGLLLRDGSQLHITPRATDSLIDIIRPGDRVRVHGRRRPGIPIIQPDVIINVTSNRSYIVPFRLDLAIPPREQAGSIKPMSVAGTIEVLLYDSLTGKITGMLLSDGSQVRLPPDVGDLFRNSLPLHAAVLVEGNGTTTPYGRALEALAIGLKGKPLVFLTPSTPPLEP